MVANAGWCGRVEGLISRFAFGSLSQQTRKACQGNIAPEFQQQVLQAGFRSSFPTSAHQPHTTTMQQLLVLPDLPRLAEVPSHRQLITPEPGSVPLVPAAAASRKRPRHVQPLQFRLYQQQLVYPNHHSPAQPLPQSAHTSSYDHQTPLDSLMASWPASNAAEAATLPFAPGAHEFEQLDDSFACSSPAGPSEEQRRQNSEFQINFGRAIRSLREDIPNFFKRESNLSIYADNMHFRDNISANLWARTFDLHGIDQYQRHCQRMRMVFNFLFKRSDVQVWRFWPKDKYVIVAKWTVKNYPRLISSQCVQIDGISEFRFNEDGFVQEHILDVIDWNGLRAALEKRRRDATVAGLVPNSCSGMLPPGST